MSELLLSFEASIQNAIIKLVIYIPEMKSAVATTNSSPLHACIPMGATVYVRSVVLFNVSHYHCTKMGKGDLVH